MPTDKTTPAIRKLELSRLDPKAVQKGGMATDTDIESLSIYLSSQIKTNLVNRIIDGSIERSVENASTLTIVVSDDDGSILNSGYLADKLDVQIDGLWFRFAGVDKNGTELTLTFEDREISILRQYTKWKVARRDKTTRAEFILNLIREVKEFKIPVVIPQLHVRQPVERFAGDVLGTDRYISKTGGIPPDAATPVPSQATTNTEKQRNTGQVLKAKGKQMDAEQIRLANAIIGTGLSMQASGRPVTRRLRICAIMTAITESVIHNSPVKQDHTSVGLFQQQDNWGTVAERTDPPTASRLFYEAAIKEDALNPNEPYWELCANVQHPRDDLRGLYALYRTEADRIVNAYGDTANVNEANLMTQNVSGENTGSNYIFYRGDVIDRSGQKIRLPEGSWHCILRLAKDVDWVAFFVAGTFYYMSQDDLFRQQPIATVTPDDVGIISMDGSYDRNKKSGSISISCVIGRWEAPPGAVVVVRNMGPMNGRWLVNDFSRSLFDDVATITLKKPGPRLPEPITDNTQSVQNTWYDQPQTPQKNNETGKKLWHDVLNNPQITFTNPASQKSDISLGLIDDRVLNFLLWMVQQGRACEVSCLRSDHSKYTSEGAPSAHGFGRAVDVDTYNVQNPATDGVMRMIGVNQVILGFDQLIGPNPLLCIGGPYDSKVLGEHKSHIHVGWPA